MENFIFLCSTLKIIQNSKMDRRVILDIVMIEYNRHVRKHLTLAAMFIFGKNQIG